MKRIDEYSIAAGGYWKVKKEVESQVFDNYGADSQTERG